MINSGWFIVASYNCYDIFHSGIEGIKLTGHAGNNHRPSCYADHFRPLTPRSLYKKPWIFEVG